jgi:hypothetical protein
MANTLSYGVEEKPIKRLLRRLDTQEYFKDDGWTRNPEEARAFVDVVEAAQTCARLGLNDVELTLRVGAAASDVFCTPIR